MTEAQERRLVFGEVAEQYERARPSYPATVFGGALAFAGYRDGEWVLEVGAGTGKATAGLVAAGARVVALEPSDEMSAVARRKFAGDERVEVVASEFERWPGDGAAFALLLAAQTWHWIDPTVRLARAQELLRERGAIALVWNQPQYPDADLRRALTEVYREVGVRAQGRFAGAVRPDGQDLAIEELRDSVRFEAFELREHHHAVTYETEAYLALLETHSDHRVMAPDDHDRLCERIAALVDAARGITVDYCATTALARRVA